MWPNLRHPLALDIRLLPPLLRLVYIRLVHRIHRGIPRHTLIRRLLQPVPSATMHTLDLQQIRDMLREARAIATLCPAGTTTAPRAYR